LTKKENKTLKVNTKINQGEKYVRVNLEQSYDQINILSLNFNQDDLYVNTDADFGVVVGRVVSSGVGIPNARVSVFVPLKEEDETNEDITKFYPYKNTESKNELNGKKYNLLPSIRRWVRGLFDPEFEWSPNKFAVGATPKEPIGTFPDKFEILEDTNRARTLREVYDKYYKYTTVTNNSGDFLLYGVPVGTHEIHMDVDLTDIGPFSMTPAALKSQGYADDFFEEGKIKRFNDLEQNAHYKSQSFTVDVRPFWGDNETKQIGIPRQDFDLRTEIRPSTTIFGSAFGMGADGWWGDKVVFRILIDWPPLFRFLFPPFGLKINVGVGKIRIFKKGGWFCLQFCRPNVRIKTWTDSNMSRLNGGYLERNPFSLRILRPVLVKTCKGEDKPEPEELCNPVTAGLDSFCGFCDESFGGVNLDDLELDDTKFNEQVDCNSFFETNGPITSLLPTWVSGNTHDATVTYETGNTVYGAAPPNIGEAKDGNGDPITSPVSVKQVPNTNNEYTYEWEKEAENFCGDCTETEKSATILEKSFDQFTLDRINLVFEYDDEVLRSIPYYTDIENIDFNPLDDSVVKVEVTLTGTTPDETVTIPGQNPVRESDFWKFITGETLSGVNDWDSGTIYNLGDRVSVSGGTFPEGATYEAVLPNGFVNFEFIDFEPKKVYVNVNANQNPPPTPPSGIQPVLINDDPVAPTDDSKVVKVNLSVTNTPITLGAYDGSDFWTQSEIRISEVNVDCGEIINEVFSDFTDDVSAPKSNEDVNTLARIEKYDVNTINVDLVERIENNNNDDAIFQTMFRGDYEFYNDEPGVFILRVPCRSRKKAMNESGQLVDVPDSEEGVFTEFEGYAIFNMEGELGDGPSKIRVKRPFIKVPSTKLSLSGKTLHECDDGNSKDEYYFPAYNYNEFKDEYARFKFGRFYTVSQRIGTENLMDDTNKGITYLGVNRYKFDKNNLKNEQSPPREDRGYYVDAQNNYNESDINFEGKSSQDPNDSGSGILRPAAPENGSCFWDKPGIIDLNYVGSLDGFEGMAIDLENDDNIFLVFPCNTHYFYNEWLNFSLYFPNFAIFKKVRRDRYSPYIVGVPLQRPRNGDDVVPANDTADVNCGPRHAKLDLENASIADDLQGADYLLNHDFFPTAFVEVKRDEIVSFLEHSLVVNPNNPNLGILREKKGFVIGFDKNNDEGRLVSNNTLPSFGSEVIKRDPNDDDLNIHANGDFHTSVDLLKSSFYKFSDSSLNPKIDTTDSFRYPIYSYLGLKSAHILRYLIKKNVL